MTDSERVQGGDAGILGGVRLSLCWEDELYSDGLSIQINSSFRRITLFDGVVYIDLDNCTRRRVTYVANVSHEDMWGLALVMFGRYFERGTVLVCSLSMCCKPSESKLMI